MSFVNGGKVFAECGRCGRIVRVGFGGGLHICRTDCQLAGKHLAVQLVRRGWIRRRNWLVCDACGDEIRQP